MMEVRTRVDNGRVTGDGDLSRNMIRPGISIQS